MKPPLPLKFPTLRFTPSAFVRSSFAPEATERFPLFSNWLLMVKARLPVSTDKLEIPAKVLSDGLPSPLYTTFVALEPPPSTSGSLLLPVMVTVPVTV